MKNYGFIKPKLDSSQYILGGLGALPKTVLQADGQWDKYLPTYEPQADKYETCGCTVWGTENALEILEKRITGIEPNFDEKYIYNLVPVRPPGADPHQVAECIRNWGLLPNRPTPATFEEFCNPTPPSEVDLKEGKKRNDKWNFGHDWVFTGSPSTQQRVVMMKEALKYSPLGISVSAWNEEDGIYVDGGQPNNHWCVCYGYTESNGKTFWKVFDSYDHSQKILHPEHAIYYCKRYVLTAIQKKENWLIALIKSVLVGIKPKANVPDIIPTNTVAPKSPREMLYDTAINCLGIDASPNDIAPDELGCAETVNEIHFKAFGEYIETPGISTTMLFGAMIDQPHKFVRVLDAEPGNIIISPTGFSNIPNTPIKNGHVGIFGKNLEIMSNSSATGKFVQNFTLDTWIDRYRKRGGYPIYYFKRI